MTLWRELMKDTGRFAATLEREIIARHINAALGWRRRVGRDQKG